MALLGSFQDTQISFWLLKLFADASSWRSSSDFNLLLESEAHLVARKSRFSPVHYAALEAFAPGLKLLLDTGDIDPDAVDLTGSPALVWLFQPNSTGVTQARVLRSLQVLLNHGANPNIANQDGITPLHQAISFSTPAAVSQLISAGANVDAVTKQNETPLTRLLLPSCKTREHVVLKKLQILLAANVNVNPPGIQPSPRQLASYRSSPAALRLLIAHGAQ